MPQWAQFPGAVIQTATSSLAAGGYGVNLTMTAANTKSSWQTLHTSTNTMADGILVNIFSPTAAARYAVDIGIGTSGQEIAIVPNIYFETPRANQGNFCAFFPVNIPTAMQVRARAQNGTGAANLLVSAQTFTFGYPQPDWLYEKVTTYGVSVAATTTGTNINCGTTANTKSQYFAIATSTYTDVNGAIIGITNNASTSMTDGLFRLDIAIGAAGSEKNILLDFPLACGTTNDDIEPRTFYLPVSIPKGNRISARGQANVVGTTTNQFMIALYGYN